VVPAARRLLIIASILPSIAGGQGPLLAHIGDRVRITAPESGFDLITGRVVAADSALLTIRVAAARGFYYVHRGEIEAIDISAESHNHMLGGMLVGAVNGIIAGIGAGSMQAPLGPETPGVYPERRLALIGGAAGLLLGGVIGLLVRSDVWVPVQMESPAPSKPPVGLAHTGSGRFILRWSVTY
jgi:hypothetical protein